MVTSPVHHAERRAPSLCLLARRTQPTSIHVLVAWFRCVVQGRGDIEQYGIVQLRIQDVMVDPDEHSIKWEGLHFTVAAEYVDPETGEPVGDFYFCVVFSLSLKPCGGGGRQLPMFMFWI